VGKKWYKEKNAKFFPTFLHDIEGMRGVGPLILNLGASWRSEVNITLRPLCHRERIPLTIEIEAGWALGPVWTCLESGRHKIHTNIHTCVRTHVQLRAPTRVLLVQSTFTFSVTEQYF
jgi:hypothetical protein